MTTLHIADLSLSTELDRQARVAVRGGADDQAIGSSQSNVQTMAAAANVGNGSVFSGPANIQSDNTFTQDADNRSRAFNLDALAFLGLGVPGLRRGPF